MKFIPSRYRHLGTEACEQEVKFYSLQLRLGPGLEAEVPRLFAVGDGAGVSRGLVQGSASGVLAAREILQRL